jgi:hypothetical protein
MGISLVIGSIPQHIFGLAGSTRLHWIYRVQSAMVFLDVNSVQHRLITHPSQRGARITDTSVNCTFNPQDSGTRIGDHNRVVYCCLSGAAGSIHPVTVDAKKPAPSLNRYNRARDLDGRSLSGPRAHA